MLLALGRTFVASLLLTSVAAAPLSIDTLLGKGGDQNQKTNASSTYGISDQKLAEIKLWSQFAAASYCADNDNVTFATTQLTCSVGNCPEVQKLGIDTVLRFLNSDPAGDTGYVALDNDNKKIVLVFRGSHTWQNWLADLDFFTVDSPWCKDCKIHKGFWNAWNDVASNITNAIDAAYKLHPDYMVTVTGHSLGGALATVAAGALRQGKPYSADLEMYNFGSPRVGNKNLAEFLTQQAPTKNWRVTAVDDPVPNVPPHFIGFDHITPEYWLFTNPDTPTPADVKVVNGYYNEAGNSGAKANVNKTAHVNYFGRIAHCSKAPVTLAANSTSSPTDDGTCE